MNIKIDMERCNKCLACVKDCLAHVILDMQGTPQVMQPQNCFKCGHCVAVCPKDAFIHELHPLSDCPTIESQRDVSLQDLRQLLLSRRSVRLYKKKEVSKSAIDELIDIARFAPTASNRQDVSYIVITDQQYIKKLHKMVLGYYTKIANDLANPLIRQIYKIRVGTKMTRKLVGLGRMMKAFQKRSDDGFDPIFYNCPALVLITSNGSHPHSRDNGCYAGYHIVMAAQSLGLGTCINGFITAAAQKDKALRQELSLSRKKSLECVLSLGYPAIKYHRIVNRDAAVVEYI